MGPSASAKRWPLPSSLRSGSYDLPKGNPKSLVQNLNHPSLHAKKYDDAKDKWKARVNRNWRLFFKIVGGTYVTEAVILLNPPRCWTMEASRLRRSNMGGCR